MNSQRTRPWANHSLSLGSVLGSLCGLSVPMAHADIDPVSGIDLVTIRAAGNAPWPGTNPPTPGDSAAGRGSVNYEYRIGRFEVATAQWAEFYNAAFARPTSEHIPFLSVPDQRYWGAVETASPVPGGRRWTVPAGREMLPVGDVSWRTAAVYCNWLHNAKASTREAFLSGAYDTATFGVIPGQGYTDQPTRSPGARYFVPTLDEQLKAFHYDPSRNGPGQGGWWHYSTTSDTAPVYGPPGWRVTPGVRPPVADPTGVLAQANSGWSVFNTALPSPYSIALGAYPNVTSPWGLLDTAGGTSEWNEEFVGITVPFFRTYDGTGRGDISAGNGGNSDWIVSQGGAETPDSYIDNIGFRVAAVVPSPSCVLVLGVIVLAGYRPRRTN